MIDNKTLHVEKKNPRNDSYKTQCIVKACQESYTLSHVCYRALKFRSPLFLVALRTLPGSVGGSPVAGRTFPKRAPAPRRMATPLRIRCVAARRRRIPSIAEAVTRICGKPP